MDAWPSPTFEIDFGSGIMVGRGWLEITRRVGEQVTIESLSYHLNNYLLMSATGAGLTPDLEDLQDIAVAVYLADRLAPRASVADERPLGERWHRRFLIRVPLRRPERWHKQESETKLTRLLYFLTGDTWKFVFSQRSVLQGHQSVLPLRVSEPIAANMLFSGGLDSYLGVLLALREHLHQPVLVTSMTSGGQLRRAQSRSLLHLRNRVSANISWAQIAVGLREADRDREHRESSQRSRGFLYLAAGTISTALAGLQTLNVTENGVGALSLPFSAEQVGLDNTRAMHPRTLALFNDLTAQVLDQPVSVINLGLWQTKAQLCAVLDAVPGAGDGIRETISCDRFPYIDPNQPCGRCTSCLSRRMSLAASGRAPLDAGVYQFDPLDRSRPWPSSADLVPLYAMRNQSDKLRQVLCSVSPSRALSTAFPSLLLALAAAPTLGLSTETMLDRLVDLYRNHVAEWDRFVALVQQPGWAREPRITSIAPLPMPATG